ncbi:hypothetical protein ES702_06921 [subsurface metagenome]
MALSFLTKIRKRSKYVGKTKAARAKQLANLRSGSARRLPGTKELSRDIPEISGLGKTRKVPLTSCDIIEFANQHLGISFKERPAQEVILRSIYGLPSNKDQLRIYRKLTGNKVEFEPGTPKSEAVLVLGARSGKSLLASIIALKEALDPKWQKYLSPGESAYVIIVATRQRQAEMIIQSNVGRLAQLSPTLEKQVVDIYQSELTLKSGIKIVSMPCSSTAARGIPILALVLDEAAYFSREGPRADEAIFSSLRPRMAQFPGAKVIIISTPGGKQGLLWQLFSEGSQVPGRFTATGSTREINPVIPEDLLKKEERRDPDNYKREFEAEFSERSSQFLPDDLIAKCCRLVGDIPAQPGVSYSCGIDQSGLSGKDRFALALAYSQASVVRVPLVRAWRTKDSDRILEDVRLITRSHNCPSALIDQYARGWVSAALRKVGLSVQVRPNLPVCYQNLKSLMLASKVLLPDTIEVKEALMNTQGYWSRSNALSIGHERNSQGHADIADALATAVWKASQTADSSERIRVELGKPFEHLSLLNPRSPIWGREKGMPIIEKHYYGEGRIPGEKISRIQPDPDLEGGEEND